mgnify:CR=1 FL=1
MKSPRSPVRGLASLGRGLAPALLAVAVVWLVSGAGSCAVDPGPALLKVVDVTPRQVELGDRVAIAGEGFPVGQAARVTFQGTLHRPGERAVEGAKIVVSGVVTAPGQVEVAFGEETQALFCGAGDRTVHTTFEGSLEVAFAAAAPGAPPVAGVLPQVTLDVRPSARASNAESEREGARLLAWIGVRARPGPSGLLVQSVDAESRARAAGIEAGDVLATFDGVRVATAADVVPAPGEREAVAGVRLSAWASRGTVASAARWHDEDLVARAVSVEGFRRAPPVQLLGAASLVLAALAVALLFGAPNALMQSVWLQRIVSRVGAQLQTMRGPASPPRRLARALGAVARDTFPEPGAPAVVDALVCALLAMLPFGQYLLAARLDVALLLVAAAAVASSSAFVASGSGWWGVRAALQVLWQHVPAAAAVASVVVTTGSLRVQEIARAQGGWPWDWLAFRSPAALVALALLLACSPAAAEGPDDADAPPGSLRSLLEGPAATAPRGPWLSAAFRAHALLVAGLASVLFLGGWALPGWGAAEQDARPALELAGAFLLLAKTWGLAVLGAWVRWACPPARLAERTRATALWLSPLAVAAFAATALWTWWGPARTVQLLVSHGLVAAVALAVVAVAARLRHGLAASGSDGRLSPFL